MKFSKLHIPTFLLSLVLASGVGFCTTMCLVDAFSLDCDWLTLLKICCAASLIAACGMLPRRIWLTTVSTAAVYSGVLFWKRVLLKESLQGFLYQLTSEFALCYSNVSVSGQPADCLPLMAAMVVPLVWMTAWVVCREGNVLLLFLLCLPMLTVCLIIVDVAPIAWLVTLSGIFLLLLLTGSTREQSTRDGSRLSWCLLLPSAAMVAAVMLYWSPADYTRSDWSTQLQNAAEQKISVERIQKELFSDLPKWNTDLKKVDLSRLGPKTRTGKVVLESCAQETDYYLRGVSLGIYENNTWKAIPQSEYAARQFSQTPSVQGNGVRSCLEIRTQSTEETIFTHYYTATVPETASYVDDAYLKNQGKLKEYTVEYWSNVTGGGTIPDGYETFVQEYYTRIPDTLREKLATLLSERGWDTLTGGAAELADCVRQSAVYDLDTSQLPEGEDFVLYFLQKSRQGYCVHFATATVMLLRTLGIPARYVTGYLVHGTAGEWTTVTEDDAHAWVEYWVSGMGWVLLDPTPAASETTQEPEQQPDPGPDDPQPEESPQEPEQSIPAASEPAASAVSGQISSTDARSGGENSEDRIIRSAWLWLLALPSAALLIWLRRKLLLNAREIRCRRGNPNRQALALWQWIVRLDHANGEEPEEAMLSLAEKAKFSQHTLTDTELAQLRDGLTQRIEKRKQSGTLQKLRDRYGRLLY